ncbi:uncharacterized protein BDW43DRAFT_282491 [Aspergillus alliaceus]|uniref:uncharacterized protein n=1 Tax=Petromyces alliaceus TaxID=209559 RepID=UPI0012A5C8C9|nr:uncharacterized protein BDW43DRAFT_282491 [Aspergillus alliaceus]KAB8231511.1 hypothetical protein BDW43DRAFT_282491 [Aspergillus alliaceus]
MPDSPIQAYLEGFETLLTTTRDKIMQLSSINKGTSDHHSKRDTQPKLIRRIFHSLRMSCNDMFCEGFDLKKIRTSNSMSAAEKQDCAACYPRPNLRLIRDRCKARNAEALQDIYWACGLLGAFAGVAVLIYRVCSCRHQHRSQTRRTPTAQSFFSSTLSIATTASPYSSLDWRKGHEPSMDNTEGSEENLFMTEQRLNRLGLFTREPRKRIRDVFDLESYGSTQEAGGISKERVPVLPRAPNASLRRHLVTRSMEQGPRFRNESIG